MLNTAEDIGEECISGSAHLYPCNNTNTENSYIKQYATPPSKDFSYKRLWYNKMKYFNPVDQHWKKPLLFFQGYANLGG